MKYRWTLILMFMGLLLAACTSGDGSSTEITLAPVTEAPQSTTSEPEASQSTTSETTVAPSTTAGTEPESPDDLQNFARDNANTRLGAGGDYLVQDPFEPELFVTGDESPPGRIIELRCEVSLCDEVGEGVAAAAGLLGWSHDVLDIGSTQQSVSGTWAVVVDSSAAMLEQGRLVVVASASAPEWSGESIQTLLDLGIPVVTYGGSDGDVAPGISTGVLEQSEFYRRGALMADIALSEGEGAIRFLAVDELPLIAVLRQGFEDELARICFEGCSLEVVSTSVQELISGAAETAILEASSLEDPPVIIVPLEQALSGSSAALASFEGEAGLPLIVTQGSGFETSELLLSGVRVASVGTSAEAAGWHLVDQGLRLSYGLEVSTVPTESIAGTDISVPVVPWAVLTDGSFDAPGFWIPVVAPDQHFAGLWGAGS